MQKVHLPSLLLLFVLLLTTIFAAEDALPEIDPLEYTEGEIITAGSSTVFPLSERMAENWTNEGGVAPSIASIGSGAGFERFCVEGEIDISNASRTIRDTEIESCATIGRIPIEFRVGTDALAVTVSSANDFVTDVTIDELVMIFSTAETCASLDPIATQRIEQLMRELQEQFTIVIVTHNMQQAQRASDYTAFYNIRKTVQNDIETRWGELVEFNDTL